MVTPKGFEPLKFLIGVVRLLLGLVVSLMAYWRGMNLFKPVYIYLRVLIQKLVSQHFMLVKGNV